MYENAHLEAPTSIPLALQAAPGRWLVQCAASTPTHRPVEVSGGRSVGGEWGVRGGVGIEIAKKSLAQLVQTGFGRSSSRDVECRVERPTYD